MVRGGRVGQSSPFTKVVSCKLNRISRLVPRVNLGVNHMALSQGHREDIVNMSREALEARLVAHEAMDVDE